MYIFRVRYRRMFVLLYSLTVPPTVEIKQEPPDPVGEGNTLLLTCDTQGGNPQQVLTYQWTFLPRYDVSSDAHVGQCRQLVVAAVEDIHSGKYICKANNIAGSNQGTREVLVHCKCN